jgi:hypothetical protein
MLHRAMLKGSTKNYINGEVIYIEWNTDSSLFILCIRPWIQGAKKLALCLSKRKEK